MWYLDNAPLDACSMGTENLLLDPTHRGPANYQPKLTCGPMDMTTHTAPRKVISPVTARVDGTERPVKRLTNAKTMAVPADGPSFLTAPLGKWSCGYSSASFSAIQSYKEDVHEYRRL